MAKSRQWAVELILFNTASGGSLTLNHFYTLENLVELGSPFKATGLIKAKFVPTWILADIANLVKPYKNRGYVLEKFSIVR